MLTFLSIRNFVIVDALDIEFNDGFTVFSGETGAGKSILIDALALACGERADTNIVREGQNRSEISAVFLSNPPLSIWLKANDFDLENDEITLRRVIDISGRSRAYINSQIATLTQLKEAASFLIGIHGQHAYQLLTDNAVQQKLMDSYAGLLPLCQAVATAWTDWSKIRQNIKQAETQLEKIVDERNQLSWQIEEIENFVYSIDDDWNVLSEEHYRLRHASDLIGGTEAALASLTHNENALIDRLHHLNNSLKNLAEFDPRLKDAADIINDAQIQLQEASSALNHYLQKVEVDPNRLQQLEERISAWHSTARRLSIQPEKIVERLIKNRKKLQELDEASNIQNLHHKETELSTRYRALADKLTSARRRAAKQLSESVNRLMSELSMQGIQFNIALNTLSECNQFGNEQTEFQIIAYSSATPKPLAKVASGGELSRIGLALAVATHQTISTPTLIFDEVDAGIGGAIAEVVGQLLQRLGKTQQVLSITHLPQVAARANNHFSVRKTVNEQMATNQVDCLNDEMRVKEIARMLGGINITSTTLKHAKEMLHLSSNK